MSRWRSARSSLAAWRRAGVAAHDPGPGVETPLVVAALARLPEDQRRAIVLFHLCDLSVDQVAAEVGAPAGTVKARLSRGRAALRELLAAAAKLVMVPLMFTAGHRREHRLHRRSAAYKMS